MATTIDPRLPAIPALGVSYDDRELELTDFQEIVAVENEGTQTEYVFEDADTFSPDADDKLVPPGTLSVVSQTVRVTSAGTVSVDIVIEIEDVPGAAEYERRDAT